MADDDYDDRRLQYVTVFSRRYPWTRFEADVARADRAVNRVYSQRAEYPLYLRHLFRFVRRGKPQ